MLVIFAIVYFWLAISWFKLFGYDRPQIIFLLKIPQKLYLLIHLRIQEVILEIFFELDFKPIRTGCN